jgi:protein-S-isoprenylcysteine O-methyltransferase Ste14
MSNSTKDRIFVSLQIILFFVFALNVNLGRFEIARVIELICFIFVFIGILLIISALFQLRKSIFPFPTPSKNASLITSGIFKYIRHPIYCGIVLLFLSIGVYYGSVYKILISFFIFGVLYLKSIHEEKLLLERFPEYLSYKNRTGRFFPNI